MGHCAKLRRPFIWQDEMMEVRELFRRVERVKRGGFAGFSTWEGATPSADTLSRNRLRRRRAQFAVELSHLNYKEAPFEALTHLDNIRGMCTRIQRQDSSTERRKKDVDLQSRPPLLRRPTTSASVRRGPTGRGRRPPFEASGCRPHSAPVPDLGLPPLQYAPPKLTVLYDIAHKKPPGSRSSMRRSASSGLDRPPTGDPCRLHGGHSPTPGCVSMRSSPRAHKQDENCGRGGARASPAGPTRAASACAEPRAKLRTSAAEMRWSHSADRLPTERMKLERAWARLEKFPPPLNTAAAELGGRSSSDGVTSSDFESSSVSRSLRSDSSRGATKGLERLSACKSPSFILPTTAYECNVLERSLAPVAERAAPSLPGKVAPKAKLTKLSSPLERPYTSPAAATPRKKADPDGLGPLKFGSPADRRPPSRLGEVTPAAGEEDAWTESPWSVARASPPREVLMEFERVDIAQKEVGADDTHVLIKHSSDPYMDFRASMLSMIQEECLQDREVEMEELFQYYLDLNPAVHHDVLHHVIRDIRTELLDGRRII